MSIAMRAVRKVNVRNWDADGAERFRVQVDLDGKPVAGIDPERITSIEEHVMDWRDASHIHAWFEENVLDDKEGKSEHEVSWGQLLSLLTTCEKVLNASQLVEEKKIANVLSPYYSWAAGALRKPRRVIKNESVASKLLPVRGDERNAPGEYDEAYLKSVEATYDWLVRMFTDRHEGVDSEIYYSFAS
jgi:hypothetical protein